MIQQFLGFHGFSFDAQVTGVAIASGVPRVTAALRRDDRRATSGSTRSWSSRASAPACRSSTTTRRRSAPTASRTRWPRTTCTAARRSSSTSAPPTPSRRSARRASTSAARSSPASRSRWTRCSPRAAALRRVELVPPKNVIGKSTVESIQSGAVYGFSGQVDALVDRFQAELGDVHGRGHRRARRAHRPVLPHDPAPRAVAHPPRAPDHVREEPLSELQDERARRLAKVEAERARGPRSLPGALRPDPHDGRAARGVRRHRRRSRGRRHRAGGGAADADPTPGQAHVRDPARRHRERSSCSCPGR